MADKRIYVFEGVSLHRATEKAYHCEIGDSLFWVPKSQIKEFEIDSGHLVTTSWWAEVSTAQEAYERTLQADRHRHAEEEKRRQQRTTTPTPFPVQLTIATPVYRKLALKWHPDRNPDSAEVMRDINELWQAIRADLDKARSGTEEKK